MQTVLGLVIHRFDIHIKRETGCFDVRGSRSQGTAEVAHFFFTDTAHSGVVGGGGGCSGGILLGTGCTERQWVGNSDTPSLIRCNLNNPPPSTHTHTSPPTSHLLMPDPWELSLSLHLSLSPPISHQYSIHTSCASVSSSSASCAALFPHTFALPLPPYQKTTHNFLSQKQDEWWRGGRQGV